jgi:hypothetical protein
MSTLQTLYASKEAVPVAKIEMDIENVALASRGATITVDGTDAGNKEYMIDGIHSHCDQDGELRYWEFANPVWIDIKFAEKKHINKFALFHYPKSTFVEDKSQVPIEEYTIFYDTTGTGDYVAWSGLVDKGSDYGLNAVSISNGYVSGNEQSYNVFFDETGVEAYGIKIQVEAYSDTVRICEIEVWTTKQLDYAGSFSINKGKDIITSQFKVSTSAVEIFDDIRNWYPGQGNFENLTKQDIPNLPVRIYGGLDKRGYKVYACLGHYYLTALQLFPKRQIVDIQLLDRVKMLKEKNVVLGTTILANKTREWLIEFMALKAGISSDEMVLFESADTIDMFYPVNAKIWDEINEIAAGMADIDLYINQYNQLVWNVYVESIPHFVKQDSQADFEVGVITNGSFDLIDIGSEPGKITIINNPNSSFDPDYDWNELPTVNNFSTNSENWREENKQIPIFFDVFFDDYNDAPLSLVVKNDNQSVSSDFEKYLLIGHFNFNESNTGYVRKIYSDIDISDIGEVTISFNFSFNEIGIQELGTRVMIAEYQLDGHEDNAWAKLYVRKVSEENFVCDLETSEGDKSWSINNNTFYNIALSGRTFFGYVEWQIEGISLIDVPIEYTSNVTLDLKCWFDEDISSDDYLYNAYILFKDITGLGNDALQYTRRYSTFVSQISDLLLIPTAWGIFETIKTNSETALIDYYTQTSDDGITFDDWVLVNSATYEIGSELKRYIRWKAILKSTNRLSIPSIDSVTINYYTGGGTPRWTNIALEIDASEDTAEIPIKFSDREAGEGTIYDKVEIEVMPFQLQTVADVWTGSKNWITIAGNNYPFFPQFQNPVALDTDYKLIVNGSEYPETAEGVYTDIGGLSVSFQRHPTTPVIRMYGNTITITEFRITGNEYKQISISKFSVGTGDKILTLQNKYLTNTEFAQQIVNIVYSQVRYCVESIERPLRIDFNPAISFRDAIKINNKILDTIKIFQIVDITHNFEVGNKTFDIYTEVKAREIDTSIFYSPGYWGQILDGGKRIYWGSTNEGSGQYWGGKLYG